jgi:hypothetical protein
MPGYAHEVDEMGVEQLELSLRVAPPFYRWRRLEFENHLISGGPLVVLEELRSGGLQGCYSTYLIISIRICIKYYTQETVLWHIACATK